jgi:hypothetical protein
MSRSSISPRDEFLVIGPLDVTVQRFDLSVVGPDRALESRPLGLALREATLEAACGMERDVERGT